MKKGEYLTTLLRAKQTVFSSREIMLLWQETNGNAAKVRINYYVRHGQLYRIRRGVYGKDTMYDRLECAVKIFTPSYVSFETVLTRAGVVFQQYGQIFAASYVNREIVTDGQTYQYKRLKDTILTNPLGIEQTGNYAIATAERAFLDVVYLNPEYHFDNLSSLNWDIIQDMLPIYGGNKRMERNIKKYHTLSKSNV